MWAQLWWLTTLQYLPQALWLVLTFLPPVSLSISATTESLCATNNFSKDLNSLLTVFCISAPKGGSLLCAVPGGGSEKARKFSVLMCTSKSLFTSNIVLSPRGNHKATVCTALQ